MTIQDIITKHLPALDNPGWIKCNQEHDINPACAATLTRIAQDLKTAIAQGEGKAITMRPDVLRFANRMAAMMDIKDEEKGPVTESYTLQDAMMNLQYQYGKIEENIKGAEINPFNLINVLIHLANFCMIATNIITKPRQPEGVSK